MEYYSFIHNETILKINVESWDVLYSGIIPVGKSVKVPVIPNEKLRTQVFTAKVYNRNPCEFAGISGDAQAEKFNNEMRYHNLS